MPPKHNYNRKSLDEDSVIENDEIDEIDNESDDIDIDDVEQEEEDEGDDTTDDEDEIKDVIKKTSACVIEQTLEEDNEYFDNDDDVEVQPDTTVEYVKPEERISATRLTMYEMVRILGERTRQLTTGSKPLIKHDGLSYDKIAEKELILNMIPYKIRRPLPNGKYELWTLDELYKDHLLSQLD
jgi:DNA-directed RNA polymerase subunit K/omega